MKYNILGNTGLKVSELCLGSMTCGDKCYCIAIGQLPQERADELVKRSVEAGINLIDAANVFSEGLSEEMTGKAISSTTFDKTKKPFYVVKQYY